MTETEFLDEVQRIWQTIESTVDRWAETLSIDIEAIRKGSVLEVEFENGRKIIINPQTPLQQVWLASVHGAFHFTRQTQGWFDTRSTKDFWQIFSEQAALEAGMALPG